MGDNWEHEIELVRVIDEHDEESPYLLEAEGQSPPEDVGGVGGFNYFREIMLEPNHPEYNAMKEWSGFWSLELSDWEKQPKVIDV
jgi:Plasmid pRiA4b ORF-3-like protein.